MTFTDHFVDLVQEGEDVAIRIGQLDSSSLIARKLAVSRRVVCASPAYLRRHGVPREPADLGGHNCLTRKPIAGHSHGWKFIGAEGEQTVAVAGSFQANHGEALRAGALQGLGIACLPTWIVGPDIQSGALRTILTRWEVQPTATEAPIYAVYPHNRHLSPKVRAFVDFIVETLGPRPYWNFDGSCDLGEDNGEASAAPKRTSRNAKRQPARRAAGRA